MCGRNDEPTLDLDFGLEVIHYESKMFYAGAALVASAEEGTAQYNAYLESFLIHARNLLEILFFDPSRTAIRAGQFFDDGGWRRDGGLRAKLAPMLWVRVSELLAHPLYSRRRDPPLEEERWPVEEIARDVAVEIERFVGELRSGPHADSPWFKKLAALELAFPDDGGLAVVSEPSAGPLPRSSHGATEEFVDQPVSLHTVTGATNSAFTDIVPAGGRRPADESD